MTCCDSHRARAMAAHRRPRFKYMELDASERRGGADVVLASTSSDSSGKIAYDDWVAGPANDSAAIVDAHRRLLTAAAGQGRHAAAADHAARILALDAYDERAHESLVQAHTVAGRSATPVAPSPATGRR